MTIETIPLERAGTDLHKTLNECADSGLTHGDRTARTIDSLPFSLSIRTTRMTI